MGLYRLGPLVLMALLVTACRGAGVPVAESEGSGLATDRAMAPSAAPAATAIPELGPADRERLGMELGPADPEGVISAEMALSVAETLNDFSAGGVAPDAFLATVVDAGSSGEGDTLAARRVWVVRYAGLDLNVPGPSVPAPATPRDHVADYAYVLLDASTGGFIVSVLAE